MSGEVLRHFILVLPKYPFWGGGSTLNIKAHEVDSLLPHTGVAEGVTSATMSHNSFRCDRSV